MNYNFEHYKRRYERAKSRQNLWLTQLYDAYDYTMPQRNAWDVRYSPGRQKGAQIYDTTAVYAVKAAVSKLQNSLTPPSQKWMSLKSGSQFNEMQADEVDRDLQKVSDLLFQKLHATNFDLAINESYYDLLVGTSALLVNEMPGTLRPFHFEVVPLFFLYPEEGPYGTVETVFRDIWELPISAVVQEWPDVKLPDTLQQKLRDNPSSLINLVEGTVYDFDKKTYHQVLWSSETNELMRDVETKSSPWIVYRWAKNPTEVLGRGPILEVLPSVKSINELARNDLIAAGFAAQGAYMGFSDGVFNPFNARLEPGAVLAINQASAATPPLQPIPQAGDMQRVQMTYAYLQEQINNLLFAQPLGSVENVKNRSATEMMLRQQNLQEIIGPAFARYQVEALMPLTRRLLFIMRKKGMVPNFEVDGQEVTIEFNSPLAQSQQLQDALAIQQMASALAALVGPEAAMNSFNIELIPEGLAKGLNVPLKYVKSPGQIETQMSEAREIMKQQQEQQGAPPTFGQQQAGIPASEQEQLLKAEGV